MKRAAITGAVGFVAASALLVVPGATIGSSSHEAVTPNNRIRATTVELSTTGGTGEDNLNFSFDNMLPGVRQTVTGTYRNVGRRTYDVWIVFNDVHTLHALSRDGEVHITSNGTEVFASRNLQDHPLPRVIRLADNVEPGAAGSFTFGFNYDTEFSLNPTAPTTWSLPYQIVATQPRIAPA